MRIRTHNIIFGIIFIVCSSFLLVPKAIAVPENTLDTHVGGCLVCHRQDNFKAQLKNGDDVTLTISKDHTKDSVHWNEDIYCDGCHLEKNTALHPNPEVTKCETCHGENMLKMDVVLSELTFRLPYTDRREMSISLNQVCTRCHEKEAEKTSDSTHQMVFDQGNRSAPLCIDCHNSHKVEKPNQPRSKISLICSECHRAVSTTYEGSVHGSALIGEGNEDVPSCVDCHGVHDISGPYDLTFRNASIIMCTTCHSDEALMSPYGISILIAETYLDDFHGRSANLFILSKSNRPTNKAVCFDCHGIHNILAPNNPASQVYPDNLLGTCQKCHTDADITFPKTWLDHYVPTIEDNPILYVINLVYPISIGFILTTSILYIFFDARKRHFLKKEKYIQKIQGKNGEGKK